MPTRSQAAAAVGQEEAVNQPAEEAAAAAAAVETVAAAAMETEEEEPITTMEPMAMEPAMEAMMAEAAMLETTTTTTTGAGEAAAAAAAADVDAGGLNELTTEEDVDVVVTTNEPLTTEEDAAASLLLEAANTTGEEEGDTTAAKTEEGAAPPVPALPEDAAMKDAAAAAAVAAAVDIMAAAPALPPLPPPKQWPPKPGMARIMPPGGGGSRTMAPKSSKRGPTYYAVRVGYAAPSPGNVSTIRSAIFLQWEDVKDFVQFVTATTQTQDQKVVVPGQVSNVVAAAAAAGGIGTEPSEDEVKAKLEGGGTTQETLLAGAGGEAAEEGRRHRQVPFHHNVEYKQFDDIEKAERYLKKVIPAFNHECTTAASGSKAKNKKKLLKEAAKKKKNKIKSLLRKAPLPAYPPPKNFNPPTKKWQSMYEAALQYKAAYGNLDVPADEKEPNYEEHAELSKWVKYQRTSYRYYLEDPMGGRHSMTEEKVNRLKELGFDWIVTDKRDWLAEPEPSPSKRKRGRPRKSAQQKMLDQLEREAAKAELAAVSSKSSSSKPSTPKPIRQKWLNMLEQLKEYKALHGTIEISSEETEEELVVLGQWCKNQRNMHIRWRQGHDVGMTQEKSDLLKEVGMDFPPAWEDMYVKIVQYKAQNGNIDISPDYDPILAAWMARQNEVLGRHLQGKSTRLNDDQAMRLLALGFQGGRGASAAKGGGSVSVMGKTVASRDFDTRWNEMLLRLKDYQAEHGHCNVPTSIGTDLAHWVAAQRRMYNKLIAGKPGKRAVLDAVKMQQLTELGFQFRPRGSYVPWEENMKGLWKFREENGHCRVPVNHPILGSFVKLVRRDFKNWMQGKPSSMTPEREAALKEVGFIFEGGKTPQRAAGPIKSWNERLEELLQYKAEFGHTVVPQNSGQLGAWVHSQRVHYKKYKEGGKSQMTAEKALKLTEIGFCFNASDRYRGNKRHRAHEQEEEEVQQLQLQQQMQHQQLQHEQQHVQQVHQQHYQQHQIQETVHVPQGFQNYL